MVFTLCASLVACSPKKAETETESTPVDSTELMDDVRATDRAVATLAFDAVDGYMVKDQLTVSDSVNYFLIASAEQLNEVFATGSASQTPDFIINYLIGVIRKPNSRLATIALDSVRASDSSIDVYLTVRQGEFGKAPVKAAQLFAIERREGYPVMQFHVNGKKDKAIVLVP